MELHKAPYYSTMELHKAPFHNMVNVCDNSQCFVQFHGSGNPRLLRTAAARRAPSLDTQHLALVHQRQGLASAARRFELNRWFWPRGLFLLGEGWVISHRGTDG